MYPSHFWTSLNTTHPDSLVHNKDPKQQPIFCTTTLQYSTHIPLMGPFIAVSSLPSGLLDSGYSTDASEKEGKRKSHLPDWLCQRFSGVFRNKHVAGKSMVCWVLCDETKIPADNRRKTQGTQWSRLHLLMSSGTLWWVTVECSYCSQDKTHDLLFSDWSLCFTLSSLLVDLLAIFGMIPTEGDVL